MDIKPLEGQHVLARHSGAVLVQVAGVLRWQGSKIETPGRRSMVVQGKGESLAVFSEDKVERLESLNDGTPVIYLR